jgi:uncharacterized membrane protein
MALTSIRRVEPGEIKVWLRKGLADMLECPIPSLFYGVVFVLMGYALAALLGEASHMVLALAGGFMLIGPFLATGLYEISRRRESGEKVTLMASILAWRANPTQIGVFAAILGFVLVIWVRFAALMFAVVFVGTSFGVSDSIQEMFFSGEGLQFLLVFILVGGLIAILNFVVSVVSVPMLLDKRTDTLNAVATSVKAVGENPKTMALWAAVVAGLTLVGLAPFFLGLVVTMPVVGHATWHAYRSLVVEEE